MSEKTQGDAQPVSRPQGSPAKKPVNCLLVAVSAVTLVCAIGVIAASIVRPPSPPTPTPTPTQEHIVSPPEVQRVAKLASTEYYLVDEVQYTQIPDNVAQYLGFKREFLALIYGTVVGGFDLNDWSLEENLWQDGTRVMLKLPPPQALYVDMDFERSHIVDTGGWCPVGCPEPVTDYLEKVLPQAEEKLKEQAIEYGLLERTAQSGRDYFYYFLKSLGFTEVRVLVDGYIYE
jgi:hypothetical protein